MSMLHEGLVALAQGYLAADEARERAKRGYVDAVFAELEEFPSEAFEHDQLPVRRTGLRSSRTRLFTLGDFRRVWLEPLSGWTTLYIGSDRRLYEYGPQVVHSQELASPLAANPIELRPVRLEGLTLGELLECRELLRRVWL